MTDSVPVLLVSGPVGAGKTTVGEEAGRLLGEAGLSHVVVDHAHIGRSFPAPADDPWNEQLAQRMTPSRDSAGFRWLCPGARPR